MTYFLKSDLRLVKAISLGALLLGALALGACNTVAGIGSDVEHAGHSLEHAAEAASR
ncbi:MAG: entericidin A/B family lipoprotein [Akkermansiaceae bacterium]|nr:entericidin A/B family lipoprotein [Akkermansiaceae bacterium]NNM30003.1 entericidin A/B family lipoprotein [Akkermansiaceae bacterium]